MLNKKEYNKKYYLEHREQLLLDSRVYAETHKTQVRKSYEARYLKNRRAIIDKSAKVREEWRKRNPELYTQQNRALWRRKRMDIFDFLGGTCLQ
jgi:hypothetical protein